MPTPPPHPIPPHHPTPTIPPRNSHPTIPYHPIPPYPTPPHPTQVRDFLMRVKSKRFPSIEKDMRMVLAHAGSLFLDPAALQVSGWGCQEAGWGGGEHWGPLPPLFLLTSVVDVVVGAFTCRRCWVDPSRPSAADAAHACATALAHAAASAVANAMIM